MNVLTTACWSATLVISAVPSFGRAQKATVSNPGVNIVLVESKEATQQEHGVKDFKIVNGRLVTSPNVRLAKEQHVFVVASVGISNLGDQLSIAKDDIQLMSKDGDAYHLLDWGLTGHRPIDPNEAHSDTQVRQINEVPRSFVIASKWKAIVVSTFEIPQNAVAESQLSIVVRGSRYQRGVKETGEFVLSAPK